ncbi:MAG: FecR family protein [Methylobacter tundripaludum]|uniref:FecR family protein n=1 Tax=Methylobacter tundripaludum TaxID=173365 RepID=A0A2S6GJH0_9GAMM|nr:FecR family protein [Methylobacter tundripaludum]MCK9636830.1 FecR family protein [Methylobacter tundripaludum]PPK65343.1 FecR family protein [Methylobacter tundripaludum]
MFLHAEPKSPSTLGTTQDQALAWFARLQDSKTSQRDRAEFADWLAASPAHQAAYDKVARLWQSQALNVALSQYAAIPLPQKQQKPPPQRWAAAACIVLASGWLLLGSGLIERWQADAVTATGEQRRIVLADGSAVTLNTDTALAFNTIGERRGVKILSGEAYFEVQPDKTRPFIVETEQGTVRVVGTRFSVKTGGATQVDVESGIVVCAGLRGDSRQLTAGQHTSIAGQGVAGITPVDTGRAFAWLNGRLIFQDQPLAEVIAELDRYHPGAIVITDAKLGQTRVTGNYKLEDTAAIVRALADISGARVINLSPYLTVLKG